ncbi:putative uncharacterized protein DDB_G0282133 [Galleria mellonella]|uniref:Transforming acidic coiled-coil-containing protein C-terminal domain-containing protein n=1 Tax=Galleria mellonella TaxID=7137 RepID=A0A6J3C6F5_GALME|nr:putative uncharacterized protein DDB_G0282133 [Galleria mellonella]
MAHNIEPMDIDHIESDFDNKENSFHHSNVLPCTEKGYEELDVSELNMKLRYSITPASSPMSKSYTANCPDSRSLEFGTDLSGNGNLTRSFNSTMKSENTSKSFKVHPLQLHTTELSLDNNRNTSVLRPLDTTLTLADNNITVTADIDENLSLPSSSSSIIHTPEATTPTKEIPKQDGGSPIMRGLKSVLNMFRSSQSPIPPAEEHGSPVKRDILSPSDVTLTESAVSASEVVSASTPVAAHRNKDGSPSKRSSPLKDSITFSDDLEKELLWKDETTILFSQEKIPIHKLFYQQSKQLPNFPLKKSTNIDDKVNENQEDNLNSTNEYMDISCNESIVKNKTITDITIEQMGNLTESENEFMDCETTLNNETELLNDTLPPSLDSTSQQNDVPIKNFIEQINNQMDATKEFNTIGLKDSIEKSVESHITENIEISTARNVEETSNIVNDNSNLTKIVPEGLQNEIVEYQSNPEEFKLCKEIDSTENLPVRNIDDIPVKIDSVTKSIGVDEQLYATISNDSLNHTVLQESADRSITSIIITENTVQLDSQCVTTNVIINEENVTPKCNILSEKLPDNCETANVTTEMKFSDDDIHAISNKNDIIPVENNITTVPENVSINTFVDIPDENIVLAQNITNIVTDNILNSVPVNVESNGPINEIPADNTNLPVDIPLPDEDLEVEDILSHHTFTKNVDLQSNSLPDVISDLNTNIKMEDANKFEMMPMDTINEIRSTANFIESTLGDNQDEEKIKFILQNDELNKVEDKEVMPVINLNLEKQLKDTFSKNSNELKEFNSLENNVVVESPIDEGIKLELTEEKLNLIETKSENEITVGYVANFESNKELLNFNLQDTPSKHKQVHITEMLKYEQVKINESVSKEIIKEEKEKITYNISDINHVDPLNCNINIEEIKGSESIETSNQKYDVNLTVDSKEKIINREKEVSINDSLTNIAEEPVISEEQSINLVEKETSREESYIELNHDKLSIKEVGNIKEETIHSTPDQSKSAGITENDIHEELLDSENNSPYVLISIDNVSKTTSTDSVDDFEKIDTQPLPDSPKIISKGYDFNFDQIDDPFATKTKIRLSPPLDSPKQSIKSVTKKVDVTKNNSNKNKRKSQSERKIPIVTKETFNNTFNTASNSPFENHEYLKTSIDVENSGEVKSLNNDILTVNDINEKTLDAEIVNKTVDGPTLDNTLDNLSEVKDISTENKFDSTAIIENNSSVEMNKTSSEYKDTSSSEQSVYHSAATSSGESIKSRNVFNIPEIDDNNFNSFTTKSKICQSPPPDIKMPKSFDDNKNGITSESLIIKENTESQNFNIEEKSVNDIVSNAASLNIVSSDERLKLNIEEKETINISTTTCSSKTTDDKNDTVREVHTDEEDTVEGPFLEAEDFNDNKMSDFVYDNADMIQFAELAAQTNADNLEAGELFIDAEAFEFLLNQNKSNVVADSGKESLFLKFDPLFAKRMSSDGVLAALNKIQKRQSTPKKLSKSVNTFVAVTPVAGPSTLNVNQSGISEDNAEIDVNITTSKPMMVVTPAVNSIVSPRKSTTPTNSNRRSITFTSPAIAVIDRLLSMSANNSFIDHDTTAMQVRREQNEADLALTQLRELLAEKEINVYNLRSESKELKNRLFNLESQMRTLESECEERLKKVNELTDKLSEKTKTNKSMAAVVEEYERTIASLIAETEQDKKLHNEERMKLIKERDEQTAHLASMEVSFSDLHSKYEKSKLIILTCKANEDTYKKSIKEFEENLVKMQSNYELLKQHATSKLNHANQELEKMNRVHEAEVLKLNAMIKRKDLHITSLEETLAQKTKANEELTAICDELINKVG